MALMAAMLPASAVETPESASDHRTTDLLDITVRARVDWQNEWQDSETVDDNSGFEGKYLLMRLDGRIVDGLTYSWRQRFNKAAFDGNFFDATDWVYINYDNGLFSFRAGKDAGRWARARECISLPRTISASRLARVCSTLPRTAICMATP